MAWGSLSWVRATPETLFGVYDSTRTSEAIWLRLSGDTAFTGMPEAMRHTIRSADGLNRPTQNVSSRIKCGGTLKTPAYHSQLAALTGMAATLTSNDLSSWTWDHYDSQEAVRYLGGKASSLGLSCSSESMEGTLMLDLALTFQKPDTVAPTLPQPANSVFPSELPYKHIESKSGFTVGGVSRTRFNSFKFECKNILPEQWEEDAYISALTYCGRDVTFSTNFAYTSGTDRTAYEAQSAQTCSIAFTRVGSPNKVFTLDFKTAVRIAKRSRTVPLGNIARQGLDFDAFVDPASSYVDFSFSQT